MAATPVIGYRHLARPTRRLDSRDLRIRHMSTGSEESRVRNPTSRGELQLGMRAVNALLLTFKVDCHENLQRHATSSICRLCPM